MNIPIGTKLAVTVGIGVVLVAGMIVNQQLSNTSVARQTELARDEQFVIADLLSASVALQRMQVGTREIRLSIAEREADQALAGLRESMGNAVSHIQAAIQLCGNAENCERLESLVKLAKDYAAAAAELTAIKKDYGEIAKPLDQINKIGIEINDLIERVTSDARALASQHATAAAALMTKAGQISIGAGLFVVVILMGAAIFGVLSIGKPIRRIAGVLLQLADGSRGLDIPYTGRGDEVGDAARTFRDSLVRLEKLEAEQKEAAARTVAELARSVSELRALGEVTRAVTSTLDLETVLTTIVAKATQLSGTEAGAIYVFDDASREFRLRATYGMSEELIAAVRNMHAEISEAVGLLAKTQEPSQHSDLHDLPSNPVNDIILRAGYRARLLVPLMRSGDVVGALVVRRKAPGDFPTTVIELLKTFSAQSVLAIQNARLFHELGESLEQQTATSEVLRIMGSSPGDLEPVFRSILENATRLCKAKFGTLWLLEDDGFRPVSMHQLPKALSERRRGSIFRAPHPISPMGRLIRTKTLVHIRDLIQDPAYAEGVDQPLIDLVDLGGGRTMLALPVLKDDAVAGAIVLYRDKVQPFSDNEIDLVKQFADQTVIAIENTRLLNELHQRTDQLGRSVGELRALGEVSQAVNSTLDLETVLSTIVAKAVQLSGTEAGAIYVFDDASRQFQLRATCGMDQDLIDALMSRHFGLDDPNVARDIAQHEPNQVADLRNEPPTALNEITLRAGYRARLTAPLFRGEDIVGLLVVRRKTPGAFAQNTIELIKTFAAQSTLAIQNARLFQEIHDKGRQLESASQHKSQFLANMSHELRTPLNAIIGYSEILQEDVVDLGRDKLVPDLKKIEGAGRHLLGLINDILDLSKIEAGRIDIFLEDVEIVPLLEEVRTIIVPLAEKNRNAVEYRLADNLGSMRTDRTRLKQCLLNILSNANKFTENGRVTLVAERIQNGRTAVRFAISDTGIGMTEEQLGRLFQAFSQAEITTSEKYGGTGLGLVITRNFCQLLGGDVTVASKPGEGSTFTITLPDRPATQPQFKSIDAPQIAGEMDNATTVLVVDDDPAARDLLTANLKGAGYRLIHATSGTEALNLARMVLPDAITLDVLMPKPDGWDVLTALKADAQLRDIPVIMVTVLSDRGIGLSLGAVEVLTKPVDRAQLSALLHGLLRREGPVLLVEDDADARELIRQSVEKMNLAVAEAVDGRQALTWLDAHPAPAMILLDLMMPEMDGFEVLDALAARADWRDIPVIVITAKRLTAVERERLLQQAQKIIAKGTVSRLDIAAAVGEAVRRRPPRMLPAGANA